MFLIIATEYDQLIIIHRNNKDWILPQVFKFHNVSIHGKIRVRSMDSRYTYLLTYCYLLYLKIFKNVVRILTSFINVYDAREYFYQPHNFNDYYYYYYFFTRKENKINSRIVINMKLLWNHLFWRLSSHICV